MTNRVLEAEDMNTKVPGNWWLGFPTMADLVPEGRAGNTKVEHYEVSVHDVMFASMKGGNGWTDPNRTYTKLIVDGTLATSDTAMERESHWEVAHEARGNVYIGGLGLGMIVHAIIKLPDVTAITIIEKSEEVVDLVQPTLPNGKPVTVVHADVFDWGPERGVKYDTIYFDIWNYLCVDNLDQISQLKRHLGAHKAKGVWCRGWQEDWLRYLKRADRWH